jgi:hypothetical protein
MQSKQAAVIVVLLLVIASLSAAGCTVMLPESQNTPPNAYKVTSSRNLRVSVQALGERQRYRISQFVSYSASQGYKLTHLSSNQIQPREKP